MVKKIKKNIFTKEEFILPIKNIFTTNPLSRIKIKQIYILLDINQRREKHIVNEIIDELCDNGFISKNEKESFSLNSKVIESKDATIMQITRGAGFAKVDDITEEIYINLEKSKNILVGDKVKLVIQPERTKKGRIEGIVSDIIERPAKKYIGVLSLSRHFGFVMVDSNKMPYDILIPSEGLSGAKNNQKVMVEIVEWPESCKNPVGFITEIFGFAGENNAEIHSILSEFDLPNSFDNSIERAAEEISDTITKEEIAKRRDMRSVTTFTIDPADAKDFDDALSIQKMKNGNWEVGVHIADVTHYVKEGSVLESEAVKRATSVYLVDRVVPMLPERLSNNLCSLRPNEDKLCFSAIFEINNNAEVVDKWFGRTVIHSNERFSYEEAQEVIESGKGRLDEEILTLDRLAKIIRAKRFSSGAIAFERDETKFKLDNNGKPIGVYFKEMKDSNQLIEEFMLLANRSVAEYIGKRRGSKRTFVYRIHDKPNSDKFKSFSDFVAKFGYKLKAKTDKAIGKEINFLLNKVKGGKEENVFTILALRTMAKARYSTSNIGHYGLAFDYYTHFTSPIRRYPDMMVHRLLQFYLDGGKNCNKDEYEDLCKHASEREILATEAERASIKYKMVEFLCDKIGETFYGHVSGVTEWGVYVELEDNKIEGMIPLRSMKDDFYQFDSDSYRLVGIRHRRTLTLGDKIKIRVTKADLRRKQLDYELVAFVDFETGKERKIEDGSNDKPKRKNKKNR